MIDLTPFRTDEEAVLLIVGLLVAFMVAICAIVGLGAKRVFSERGDVGLDRETPKCGDGGGL